MQVLEAKAIVDLSRQELGYYDHIIEISHEPFRVGDLAEIDFDRIELQRVRYESDLQSAEAIRAARKCDSFSCSTRRPRSISSMCRGRSISPIGSGRLDAFHQIAVDNRPDLRAALQSVQQADTDHKLAIANGSTDPSFSGWYTYNSSTNNPART